MASGTLAPTRRGCRTARAPTALKMATSMKASTRTARSAAMAPSASPTIAVSRVSLSLSVCLSLPLSLPPSLPPSLPLPLPLSLSSLFSLLSLSLSEGAREREGMREGERAAVWRALCRHRFCKGGARGGDARECAGRWGPTEEFTCLLLLAISAADLPASPVPPQANSRTTRRTALDATRAPMVVCTVDVGSSSCL